MKVLKNSSPQQSQAHELHMQHFANTLTHTFECSSFPTYGLKWVSPVNFMELFSLWLYSSKAQ